MSRAIRRKLEASGLTYTAPNGPMSGRILAAALKVALADRSGIKLRLFVRLCALELGPAAGEARP